MRGLDFADLHLAILRPQAVTKLLAEFVASGDIPGTVVDAIDVLGILLKKLESTALEVEAATNHAAHLREAETVASHPAKKSPRVAVRR